MHRSLLATVALAAALVIPGTARPAAAAGPDGADGDAKGKALAALLDRVSPSIVTLRLIVKTEMTIQGMPRPAQESRRETRGVVVTPDGLIMTAEGGFAGAERGNAMVSTKETVTAVQVVVGREDKRYDATLVATDSKLHLAFVQVNGLGDRTLTPVDFAGAATPAIGDAVVGVSRLDGGYDYTPYFTRARIGGKLTKPRKAWLLDSPAGAMGLPVFTSGGQVIGVVVQIDSGIPEEAAGGGGMMGMLGSLMRGAGAVLGPPMVLPARTARASIAQAQKRAAEQQAKAAAKDAEKQAAKKAEPKPEKKDDF